MTTRLSRTQKSELLAEVNRLLESEGPESLVPLLRKAVRLAQMCDEHEYKVLFESHLTGVDPSVKGVRDNRVQIWPYPERQPRFDVAKMLFEDRRIGGGKIDGKPAHSIVEVLAVADQARSRVETNEAIKLTAIVAPARQIIERIRDRVGVLARVVEDSLHQESEQLGPSSLRSIADGGKIFIGHGHSGVWKDLREFLSGRLGLPCDEFNHETPAGQSNKEVLQKLLEHACFAFLVMTGEDQYDDGQHARENVIHEVGLFQGRLGFERAIVLLEDGCREFSNIDGIGQIRFPKDGFSTKTEEIRRVLEREGIILPA